MNITHPELVKALLKPGQAIVDSLNPLRADALHNAVGISGEAGELSKAVMLAINLGREDGTIDTLDRANIVEELGDLHFYLEGLRQNYRGMSTPGFDYTPPSVINHEPHLKLAMTCLYLESSAADVLDAVKKEVIYEKPRDYDKIASSIAHLENSIREFGSICNAYGYACLGDMITHEEVIAHNIAKLSVRYGKLTYSNEAAQERADKAAEDLKEALD